MKIKIKRGDLRKDLFSTLKINLSKSWLEIYKEFNVPKSTFERYKNGEFSIPEDLFNKLLEYSDKELRKKILLNLEKLPDNYGAIIGGKRAYIVNKSAFSKGRKDGLLAIRKKMNLENIYFDNFELTPEVCELIGAFIGDGMFNVYNNKTYHIEFACDKRYDLDYYNHVIIPAAKKIYDDAKVHFYPSFEKENAYRVVFYSKKLFLFLKDFCGFIPGKKSHTISIPKFLLDNDIFRNRVIRGIFDTDGGIFFDKRAIYKKPYPRIIFQTVSKPLFEQLNSILSKEFNLYTRFNPKRQIYIIEIYRINQIKHWMKHIGFSNSRHLIKMPQ